MLYVFIIYFGILFAIIGIGFKREITNYRNRRLKADADEMGISIRATAVESNVIRIDSKERKASKRKQHR